jgi:hypothetical protein
MMRVDFPVFCMNWRFGLILVLIYSTFSPLDWHRFGPAVASYKQASLMIILVVENKSWH